MRPANVFDDGDVAQAYQRRPPYPPALFRRLLELTPGRRRAVDLGCGPGKIALELAGEFDVVLAADPATPMLALGQETDAGRHPNIRWTLSTAEALDFPGACDLIVAGASTHWMDHAVVFPKLAEALAPEGVLALIDGDGPHEAPWRGDYIALMAQWVARLGGVWGDPSFSRRANAHEKWIDVQGRESFTTLIRQPLEDLIEAEHSRATWARRAMGDAAARKFDADMRRLLAPYCDQGMIEYEIASNLLWGRPRPAPRSRTRAAPAIVDVADLSPT
jgi:SAM-dependent methyltransferase